MNNSKIENIEKKIYQKQFLTREELLDYIDYYLRFFYYHYCNDKNKVTIYFHPYTNRDNAIKLCEEVRGWKIVNRNFERYEILETHCRRQYINPTEVYPDEPKFKIEDIRDLSSYLYNFAKSVFSHLENINQMLKSIEENKEEKDKFLENEKKLAEKAIKECGKDVILIGDWMNEENLVIPKNRIFCQSFWQYKICPKIVMEKEEK